MKYKQKLDRYKKTNQSQLERIKKLEEIIKNIKGQQINGNKSLDRGKMSGNNSE